VSVDVTVETTIRRPPEEVAAYAMDPGNDARWIGALSSVRVLTDGPVGVGTQVERVAEFLGREMRYVNEIVELDPPRRLAMRSVKAPFPMTVDYEFDEARDGTLARIRAVGNASGFYGLASPLLSKLTERGIRRDLRNLKRILESA
jgi:uncharacterized protein YndB with AHSA1/START domain